MFSLGGRESSVLLEQRVHHEPDQRQRSKDSANYVPRFVPQLKNPLEQVSCISTPVGVEMVLCVLLITHNINLTRCLAQ